MSKEGYTGFHFSCALLHDPSYTFPFEVSSPGSNGGIDRPLYLGALIALSQIPFEHCGKHMGRRNLRSEEDPVTARSGYSLCVSVVNAAIGARSTIVIWATLTRALKRRRNSLLCLVLR